MDLATIIGIVMAVGLVVTSVFLGGTPMLFIDVQSFLVVIGGTIGATLIRNPLSTVATTFSVAARTFITKVPAPDVLLDRLVELAQKARGEGILALEDEEVDYPFLKQAISMCVDGGKEEDIRATLATEFRMTTQRHGRGQEILKGMGQAAPAFGMIGTLMGLVQMLAELDDPANIGPAMALALLTTLYGALFANVFCLPMADKLKLRSEQEQLCMMLCTEGVIGLARGVNPRTMEQQLGAFLSPRLRQKADQNNEGGAGEPVADAA